MSELNQKEVNEQMYLFVKRWLDDLPFEESKKIPVMAIGYCLARLSKQDDLLKEQEAVEQKTGHWIWLQYCANEGVYCSECHTKMFDRYPMKKKLSLFCGHCGAKMGDEVESR